MVFAHPSPKQHVIEIDGDVPLELVPVEGEVAEMALALHSYERPLAAPPWGARQNSPAGRKRMLSPFRPSNLRLTYPPGLDMILELGLFKVWVGICPSWQQVVRRITRDKDTHQVLESLDCDGLMKVCLHRDCLPGCSWDSPCAREVETLFLYRVHPFWTYGRPLRTGGRTVCTL